MHKKPLHLSSCLKDVKAFKNDFNHKKEPSFGSKAAKLFEIEIC